MTIIVIDPTHTPTSHVYFHIQDHPLQNNLRLLEGLATSSQAWGDAPALVTLSPPWQGGDDNILRYVPHIKLLKQGQ